MKRLLAWTALFATLILFTIVGARIVGHYTSGADRTDLFQESLNSDFDYHPTVGWRNNDLYTRYKSSSLALEQRIIEAFYWLNNSIETKQSLKLRDYYDVDQYAIIDSLLKHQTIDLERAYLSYNLELKHMSLDKSVAVVKCHTADVVERIIDQDDKGPVNFYSTEFSLIMVVIDGKWKIKNWITEDTWQTQPTQHNRDISRKLALIPEVVGINYYPKDSPWHLFWDSLNIDTIKQDFNLINELGFNTIRIFLSYSDFKSGSAFERNLPKFQLILDIAQEHRLKVIPTLFDFPGGYRLADYVEYDRQLKQLMTDCSNHPGLLAWNLKNEPDLDFAYHGEQATMDWLTFVLTRAKAYDTLHPITVSWSDKSYLNCLSKEVDYLSFHLYKDFANWETTINQLARETGKHVLLEEFGTSTRAGLSNLLGRSESRQHKEIKDIVLTCEANNIPFMVWTLYDFKTIPNGVFGWKPWVKAKQKNFGIVREDGTHKPATAIFEK